MKKKFKTTLEYKKDRLDFLHKGLKLNKNNLPSKELLCEHLNFNQKETDSWFDIGHSNKFNKNYNIKFKNEKLPTNITKCKKINIIFNDEQNAKVLNWFEGCRVMYNKTVSYFKKCTFDGIPINTNFKNIRTYVLKDIKDKIN